MLSLLLVNFFKKTFCVFSFYGFPFLIVKNLQVISVKGNELLVYSIVAAAELYIIRPFHLSILRRRLEAFLWKAKG